ncbi:MFS transporter [Streptomyces spiramenti]|uniref:MFS transporter n=1 Tax=Streptomyces spiramenti TaxID=2720606 RepID=A0ABX1AHM3_9ACTN|nr:MFS transporter [Streptomyces spiramenti]NJP65166.1 MFS transporter [Streptomyces spiramenti]
MTQRNDTGADPTVRGRPVTAGRSGLVRWLAGYGTFGVPQAAAPIAFALLALPLTGSASHGAALVAAMTTAQVVAALPLSRLGVRFDAVGYLRVLIVVRTLGLVLVAALASAGAPFALVMAAAASAGAVNGAAYGYLRLLLNHVAAPDKLPRALGIAATLNEATFAAAPVVASVAGSFSPAGAVAGLAVTGMAPVLLIPRTTGVHAPPPAGVPSARFGAPVYLWLFCTASVAGAVAAVEVGAVSLALRYGLEAGWGFVFALALCLGSISGGVWVSVRNRMPDRPQVLAFLGATTLGAATVAAQGPIWLTLLGATAVGFFLPPLGTYFSLVLDRLAPEHRRAEVFAFMRTANALGVIAVSGLLAVTGTTIALGGGALVMGVATLLVAVTSLVGARRRGPDPGPGD